MPVPVHIRHVFITVPDQRVIVQPCDSREDARGGDARQGKAQPIAAAKDILDAITEDWNEWRGQAKGAQENPN